MSAATILARGRLAAERNMVDTCLIEHLTSQTTDQASGVVTEYYATLYNGVCRVQQSNLGAVATPHRIGEATVRLLAMEIQVPVVGTEGADAEDRITILTCVHDTDLVGKVFHIKGVAHKTHATARRFQCQQATS